MEETSPGSTAARSPESACSWPKRVEGPDLRHPPDRPLNLPGDLSMMTDKDMALAAASVRSESPTTWKSRLKQAARAYTVPTSPLRPLPDFLIIGAQRTGTTSLY